MSFSSAVKRIKDINWSIEEEPKESHSVLLSEYLRRMAVFVKTYSSNHNPIGSPLKIFNIDDNNLLLKIDRNFDEKLPNINNPIHYKICRNYLEAASIVEMGHSEALKVANIYEPIINFFERGGNLRFDSDRALSCGSAAFVLENWVDFHSSRIEKDISDFNLERIDLNETMFRVQAP
ncbi:hypothetical protein [Paenibacillus sp. JJ-223]|uniref:hypothetical protein n=1 Tax=Paenibacillus sp. JJ-223 TaxID=2905647 RepID=UPI001F26DF58|nr:hypothetical protein [Paenibacillus sp. JJ-223]